VTKLRCTVAYFFTAHPLAPTPYNAKHELCTRQTTNTEQLK